MLANQDVPIITTKLHRPLPAADLISRPKLLERLNHYREQPLTLVSAPAGYGKTTLISSWLESLDSPSAWISLDEYDNDLTQFMTYFLMAVRSLVKNAAENSLALLKAAEVPPIRVLVSTLINDLAQIDRTYVLVLDDYHAISNMDIHDVINGLLRYPPPGMHLVLTTRKDPPLRLIDLRARSWQHDIRVQELRFTRDEIFEYLQRVLEYPLDEETAEQLAEKSEGWVTGLRLLTLSLQRIEDIDLSKIDRLADNQLIEDYLMSVILSYQEPAFQACLLKTAVLNRFCAPLCEAICGPDAKPDSAFSGEEFITLLEGSNLFVTQLDTQHQWFRYHHLFQTLLLRQLKKQEGDAVVTELHKRASVWYQENGFIDEALRHTLSAGDIAGASEMVAQHRHDMMNRERWRGLDRWLNQFPQDSLETFPDLLMARAWVAYYLWYDLSETMRILAAMETLLNSEFAQGARADQLKAEAAAIRSQFQWWYTDAAAAMASAQHTLDVTPLIHECVRSTALMIVAASSQMLGDFDKALVLLKDSLREGLYREQSSTARLLVTLIWIYWLDGDLTNSMETARRLYELSQEHDMVWSTSYACYFLGVAHLDRNELDAAEKHLAHLIENPYRYPMQNVGQGAFPLALVYQTKGQEKKARDVAQFVSDLAFEKQNDLFAELAEVFQAELELRRGHAMVAINWAQHYVPGEFRAMQRHFLPELTYAKALLAQDTHASRAKADDLLSAMKTHAQAIYNNSALIRVLVLQALLAAMRGKETDVVAILEQAVRLGELGGWIRPFVELGPEFIKPLQQLRENDVAPEYIGRILAAFPNSKQDDDAPMETSQSGNAQLIEPLTERELDVLRLLAKQMSNKEIAAELFISAGTVKQHTYNIYQKLEVKGRWQAVTRAVELGILQPSPASSSPS